MQNTGKKIVLTLKQVNSVTFAPTGLTEPNDPSSPDYIPPYTDIVDCPVSYSFACPLAVFQGYTSSVGYEFSLYNSVVQNPNVTSVAVSVFHTGSGLAGLNTYTIPAIPSNYFSGSVNIGLPGTYYATIQYFSGSTSLTTCTYSSSLIVVH